MCVGAGAGLLPALHRTGHLGHRHRIVAGGRLCPEHDHDRDHRYGMMTPMNETSRARRISAQRRRLLLIAILLVVAAVVIALAAAWLFFFGSEAPPAPSLDDALQLLQTPLPEG